MVHGIYMQLLVHTVDSVLGCGVLTLTKPTRIQQKSQSGDKTDQADSRGSSPVLHLWTIVKTYMHNRSGRFSFYILKAGIHWATLLLQ